MIRGSLLLTALLGLVACGNDTSNVPPPTGTGGEEQQQPQPPDEPDETAGPEVLDPPPGPHPVEERPELVGSTREQMHERFGEPTRTHTLRIGDGVTEFQIELLNHYPPDDPASEDVEIREEHWVWDDHTLTLWFHEVDGQWVVLETVHFGNDVEF